MRTHFGGHIPEQTQQGARKTKWLQWAHPKWRTYKGEKSKKKANKSRLHEVITYADRD